MMRILCLLSLVLFFSATFAKKRHLLLSRHLETAPSSDGVVFPKGNGWTMQKESTFKYAQWVLQHAGAPKSGNDARDKQAKAWLEKYTPSQYWKGLMAWGITKAPHNKRDPFSAMFMIAVMGDDKKRKFHYVRIDNFATNMSLWIEYIGEATENCKSLLSIQTDEKARNATCDKWMKATNLPVPVKSSKKDSTPADSKSANAKTPDSSSSNAKTPSKLSSSVAGTFTLAAFALFSAML